MSCVRNAVGWDGTTNGASTCTATASNATVCRTLTLSSANRSDSFHAKAGTVTGAISVARDGSTFTAISGLSTSTWMWIRNACTGSYNDPEFPGIDNCIAAANLTGAVLNPQDCVQIANSGDSVIVDMFQDEAADWASSPMSGFSRVKDNITSDNSTLPTTQGELSVDLTTLWTAGTVTSGQQNFVQTNANNDLACGMFMVANPASGDVSTDLVKTNSGDAILTGHISQTVGVANNIRLSWGGGSQRLWNNGDQFTQTDAGVLMPTCHTGYEIGQSITGAANYGGWISRIRWTNALAATFQGSVENIHLFGDSIVAGDVAGTPFRPSQVLTTLVGGGFATERYVHNDGLSGNTVEQCAGRMNTRTDLISAAGTQSRSPLVWQCGINSVTTDAGSILSTWNTALGAINYARDAGINVLVSTITPANQQCTLDDFNALLRAHESDAGYIYADTYAAMLDPLTPCQLNPLYDSGDHGHPNGLGSAVMSGVWFSAGRSAGYW